MHRHNLSPKAPRKIHVNRANKKAVQGWQYRLDKRISRLERDGFIMVMQDEAFFIHDVITGRKYWVPKGQRINIPYTGSHKRITAYGALAKGGRQFFRTYEKFDSPTFVKYLTEMQRWFGKVVVVTDRVSPHRSRFVKKLLRRNRHIKIIYFPEGSPYLNAVEECWYHGKRILLAFEYYRTFQDMHRAVLLYYRTARFKLDLLKFTSRKYEALCKDF